MKLENNNDDNIAYILKIINRKISHLQIIDKVIILFSIIVIILLYKIYLFNKLINLIVFQLRLSL